MTPAELRALHSKATAPDATLMQLADLEIAAIDALPALLDVVDAAQAFYDVAPVMPTARLEARMQDLGTALAKVKTP